MGTIFFQNWDQVLRTVVATVATYLVLIILLRIAGQRTLAKWYAFDLIVTVALGSTFATGVLAKDVTVVQAVVGFIVLIVLQYSIAWAVVRWAPLRSVVNPPPTLVVYRGEILEKPMRRQRVAVADVRAAIRQSGCSEIESIAAVVLEADGTFSVIREISGKGSSLADVPEFGGSNERNKSL